MFIPKIRTDSTISKFMRPRSPRLRRSPLTSSTSSHSSSPPCPSPLSYVMPSGSPESESDTVVEEDLTTMELLREHEDTVQKNHEGIVEEPVGSMDPEYYMEMVVFKIEDVLFRVPAHLFKSCTNFFDPFFEELNNMPEDQRVIKRDDVDKEDFRALLKLLYPMSFALSPTLLDDEWISVLRVSTTWLMLDIRHIAIEHLTSAPLSLVDRIVLARECNIISWLRSAYLALVEVDSELSRHDSVVTEMIGLESSFKLHRVRESVLPSRQRNSRIIDREIEKEFKAEFEALSDKTA
ncbi:hypothetical protein E4T56_gene14819, partial [Termitomyces sp. T112]